jgi:hypothetical protein
VLAFPPGHLAIGTEAIRQVYAELLASPPRFTGVIRPAIRNGDIAITSTTRAGNATGSFHAGTPIIKADNRPSSPALALATGLHAYSSGRAAVYRGMPSCSC